MKKGIIGLFLFFSLIFLLFPQQTFAYEKAGQGQTREEKGIGEQTLEELQEEMDFSSLDDVLRDMDEKTSFSDLFEALWKGETKNLDITQVMDSVKDVICVQVRENRKILAEILLLLAAFSILSNFTGMLEKTYVSDICFMLLYSLLSVLLLQSVMNVSELVSQSLQNCISFMKALVPTFCFTMMFSSNVNSSLGFYQLSFLVIYLVEWIFERFLLPGVHFYILLELFGNFFEEDKFKGFTELMKSLIQWTFKACWGIILGLNVIQNLIAPAKDRLTGGAFGKVASFLPGIGNSFSSVSELLVGSGMVIKNCVGVAALLLLGIVCLVPFLKIMCMVVLYKVTGAIAGPISDKRIYGCMEGVTNGCILYAKTLGTCLLLFVVTIALTTAATSAMY